MKRLHFLMLLLRVPLDFFALVLSLFLSWELRFSAWFVAVKPVIFTFSFTDFLARGVLVIFLTMLFFAWLGMYGSAPRKLGEDIVRIFFALSASLAVVALLLLFTQDVFESRFLVIAAWSFALGFVVAGRVFLRLFQYFAHKHGAGMTRLAILGDQKSALHMARIVSEHPSLGFVSVGAWDSFAKAKKDPMFATVEHILLTSPYAIPADTRRALDYARQAHMPVMYTTDIFGTYAAGARVFAFGGETVAEVVQTPLEGWGRIGKRVFDIIFSLCVLIIFSPLFALIAFCVLLETGRPIIYKNERVGLRGGRFFLFKFRSMHKEYSTGAQFGESGERALLEEEKLIAKNNTRTGPIYKIGNDPRVTRFGAFLRRWSLDELPQFWNVLIGEMSVVGPRPHQPREVAVYADAHPEVFILRPGITGLAQVSGRSDLSFDEEIRLDMLYTRSWNVWLDCVVILKTPFVIFQKRKAL